jgi:vitamin B12 transporter
MTLSVRFSSPCNAWPRVAFFGLAATLLAGNFAYAQLDTTMSSELPTIVVSPTAIPTPIDQIASSVTVITAEDIEREQRRTGPDVLATVPGLNVVQAGGPGAQTSVFIRGTNANHVKVFIDGIDVSDPSNPARTFEFGHLLTSDIERIEVLRGPQSGLYGADAIGGVISVTTKKGKGPPRATGLVEAGSFGTYNQFFSLSGSQDIWNYSFNVAHLRANETPVTPLELLPPGRRRIDDYYDNWTYSTKLGADFNEYFSVNFVARHTDTTLRFTQDDFSFFPSVPADNQSTTKNEQLFTRGEGILSLFGGSFVNRFSVAYTDHQNWNIGPVTAFGTPLPNINNGDRLKFDWRGDIIVAPGHTVLVGLQQERETLHTTTTDAENSNRAAYAELQSGFHDRFFIVANARYDDNERFGGHATWRVAPAILIPETGTKLKASVGTGFKAPTLTQLFVDFPPFFFGNPNLLPEESIGYDAGFEQSLFDGRVRFGATYFYNDITNLITANATFTSYANVGSATTRGVEAFAEWRVNSQFTLRGDYTHTIARDEVTGLELLRRPRHKGSVTATYRPIEALTLSATVLGVSEFIDGNRDFSIQRLVAPGYVIVNVAANYTIDKHASVFGRIDNLFDKHYQNPTGFLRPGIGVYAGLRLTN